jgi:hypothetical protein
MNGIEKMIVNYALGELAALLEKVTPDMEQKWADAVKAKIGGNETFEFAAIKDAVAIAQAAANLRLS